MAHFNLEKGKNSQDEMIKFLNSSAFDFYSSLHSFDLKRYACFDIKQLEILSDESCKYKKILKLNIERKDEVFCTNGDKESLILFGNFLDKNNFHKELISSSKFLDKYLISE